MIAKPGWHAEIFPCSRCGNDTQISVPDSGVYFLAPPRCAACAHAEHREYNQPHQRVWRWIRSIAAKVFGFDEDM